MRHNVSVEQEDRNVHGFGRSHVRHQEMKGGEFVLLFLCLFVILVVAGGIIDWIRILICPAPREREQQQLDL